MTTTTMTMARRLRPMTRSETTTTECRRCRGRRFGSARATHCLETQPRGACQWQTAAAQQTPAGVVLDTGTLCRQRSTAKVVYQTAGRLRWRSSAVAGSASHRNLLQAAVAVGNTKNGDSMARQVRTPAAGQQNTRQRSQCNSVAPSHNTGSDSLNSYRYLHCGRLTRHQ